MAYKIIIGDRDYSSWTLHDSNTLEQIEPFLVFNNPFSHFLFSGDVFDLVSMDSTVSTDSNTVLIRYKVSIRYSPVRCNTDIPAVLHIASNKTYGQYNGRNLYKCVPDDMRLPAFLVPYTIKNVGFSKVFINLYVTIKVVEWSSVNKAPIATITQNLGPIDILNNYYEYQLYCKSLNSSIQKFNKDARLSIGVDSVYNHDTFIEGMCNKYPTIENRSNSDSNIFTIDPVGSTDLDDGFSIRELSPSSYNVSIYIANVTVCMDFLNLWSSFSQRISTIYLPDKKRPMLPTILSDCLCSLQVGCTRVALVLDIVVETDLETGLNEIVSYSYSNCIIKVSKNFVYEAESLLLNPDYKKLLYVCNSLSQNKKYKYISSVKNSHDLVTYLMILMNHYSAKTLLTYHVGIFRSTIAKTMPTCEAQLDHNLNEDIKKFVSIWNSEGSHYIDLSLNQKTISDSDSSSLKHSDLGLDAYVHITSPIRRIVDLLNIIQLQKVLNLTILSEKATLFLDSWLQRLDYINVTTRAIKRIQNDCTLLDTCFNNPVILERLHDGYCFDKIVRADGLYQYVVYLPELKLTTRVTIRESIENFEKRQWKLFVFNNEAKSKRKIRLSLSIF
jgi:exoribonuclease R